MMLSDKEFNELRQDVAYIRGRVSILTALTVALSASLYTTVLVMLIHIW